MQFTKHIDSSRGARKALIAWACIGSGLLALTVVFTLLSPLFGYSYQVVDMPVFWLASGLCGAGVLYLVLPWTIRASQSLKLGLAKTLLWTMLAAGLAMRLILFASEPALEDDFQRYLWDGAVTAQGLNPYAKSPETAKAAHPQLMPLGRLANESGQVLGRINHPDLRTIYPPVAQGVFAIAHWLAPWNLNAWRGLVLALDMISIALLLLLLRELGRSPLWAALYWWNPIVLKELFNSAHMDALLAPLILGALLLAIRKRPITATACLTLAAGVKIWPLILLLLVWREILDRPKKLIAAVALTTIVCAVFAWPVLTAGLDASSGFAAYASKWKTNSALFPQLETLARFILDAAGLEAIKPGLLARAVVVSVLAAVIILQCRMTAGSAQGMARKFLIVTAALFLLSPAQFPWYYLWILPLLACFPVPGLLVLSATLPLYYTSFYFITRQSYEIFTQQAVWLIWLPVWGLLLWHARGLLPGFSRPARRAA